MGSQSEVDFPSTRTWPEVGESMRLMRRKRVVLPLPLRPNKTNVSEELTESETFEIRGSALPLTLYVTSWNRMIASWAGFRSGMEPGAE